MKVTTRDIDHRVPYRRKSLTNYAADAAHFIPWRENGFARDVVELALGHVHDNEVARAYDRGERFDERISY